ncbi:hypothetical protein [Phormidium yuhuli]|nr:hypothetical protein [Phormidium yuhuli]
MSSLPKPLGQPPKQLTGDSPIIATLDLILARSPTFQLGRW